LAVEKAEVARLKSVEQIRLRRLGEKKREVEEERRRIQGERDKDRILKERENKEKCIREWEMMEAKIRRLKEQTIIPKVLENDEGCEQVSRSYHIANLRSSSKSPKSSLVLRPVTSFGNL